jgi:hypothetical protein
LRKLYKILKPGGTLHVVVKKGMGEKYVKEKLSRGNARFYTYFSKKEMERLLKDSSFKITLSKIVPNEHKRKGLLNITMLAKK